MPLSTLLNAVAEHGVNLLLKYDCSSGIAGQQLSGKLLSVEVQGLIARRYLLFRDSEILILDEVGETPDCAVTLTPSALPHLHDPHLLTELIKSDRLIMEGDIRVAQQFGALLSDLDLDIEELLSRRVGDPLAYTLCRHGRELKNSIKQHSSLALENAVEVLLYEWQWFVSRNEWGAYTDQLRKLEQDLNRLDRRVKTLKG